MSALFKKGAVRVAPRYRFSEEEKEVMRFTTSRHTRIFKTPIFDISETGVAFLTSSKLAPQVGEIIKMDFAPLGTMRMACLGRVMRIEEPTRSTSWAKFPSTVKVGISFHDLPKSYRKVLAESLLYAFKNNKRSSHLRDVTIELKGNSSPSWLMQNIWSVLFTMLILGSGGYGIFYLLQNGAGNSQAASMSKEAGWASNFFERTINK